MKGLASILWHFFSARRNWNRWRTRAELEAWQNQSARRHLAHVVPRSPFYQRLYGPYSLHEWQTLPIIGKAEMMANFDELNTIGLTQREATEVALHAEQSRDFASMIGDVTVGLSSGTSGNRGLFLVRPQERHAWVGHLLARILPGSLLERHRAALFLRANSNLYGSIASRRIRFEFFDLLEPLPGLIGRLDKFNPSLLAAPPSMLRLLADAQRAGKLKLHAMRIFSIAEVLEAHERRYVEETFGQKLHEIYQATEGFLGVTCSHGTLHLNEDILAVQKEWINREQRKFIPIVTDFRRTTQPILRYRLNDILQERAAPCPCGNPFTGIESIEGRCDDIFKFRARTTSDLVPVFPDFIRRAIMTASDAISEYQVVQRSINLIEVSLEVSAKADSSVQSAVRKSIKALCEEVSCQEPEIHFTRLTSLPPGVKRRRVWNLANNAV